jgi:2,4-dienoyl-CoA reductase-like NADH-dependent reductase (Old Yellow Enzyme family)
LLIETFKAVRARVGSQVPLGVRISQGKVNDYQHKWAGAERDAEVIFGSLAEAGADFIHVTEFEAWKPAFASADPSLMRLAKRYAPKAVIFANGSLHNVEQAVAALDDGADIVTLGRGALANPDLPKRLAEQSILNEFDPTILGPIADIKDVELAM